MERGTCEGYVRVGRGEGRGVQLRKTGYRGGKQVDSVTYRCGDFNVDAANRRFTRGHTEVSLEPKAFAVILQLLARAGSLVTRNELLDAVWGHRYVTPSTLNRVIALVRSAFGDSVQDSRYVQTVHGAGYRYIGPIELLNPARADAQLRFGPSPIASLPARTEALIGREGELALLADLLREHRAVTLLGTGGIGKTQCALEAARRSAADFADGVWFFDLVPLNRGEEWLHALATALALPVGPVDELLTKICATLRGRHALLVLDNCDRIAAEVGALVIEMLRSTDVLKVLATSQSPLKFVGEQVMRLPPLAVPDVAAATEVPLTEIEKYSGVEMLLARIRALQPTFLLDEGNVAAVSDICRQLDGLPLALELAAPRFALLSPQQVLERLDQRFRFLQSDVAGRDSRHRNLLELLDWSFTLLSPDERRLLSWCGVFVRGWTVEGALSLAAPLGISAETLVDLLNGLVSKSLVTVNHNLTPPRYQLLETVREYALARLRSSGDETKARDAHLAFVVRMSESAYTDLLNGQMLERIGQLIHEHGNIGSAIDYSASREADRKSAQSIVGSLMVYSKAGGDYLTTRIWCRQALQGCDALESREYARALLALAVPNIASALMKDEFEVLFPRAVRILEKWADHWGLGYGNGYYALWLANWGRHAEATKHLAVAARIGARLGDSLLVGLAELARGWVYLSKREPAAAIPVLDAARHLGRDVHQRHFVEIYLALARFGIGSHAQAAANFLEAQRMSAAVGNVRGVAGSIEGCAYLAEKMGEHADAVRFLGAAELVRERTSLPLFQFWVPYHDAATTALRAKLGPEEYEACQRAGRQMRVEDAANEVAARLRSYSHARAT